MKNNKTTNRNNEITNKNSRVVCLLSGGLDSTTLTHDLALSGYEVHAISFNYLQRHVKELSFAIATCEKLRIPHKIIDISAISSIISGSSLTSNIPTPHGEYNAENMKLTVVPNRNMILISLATAYAISIGASKVYYACHSGDHFIYSDCRPEFVSQLGKAITLCDESKVELVAPYSNLDKGDIVNIGKVLQVDYSKAWSCYEGGLKPCQLCGACNERAQAFAKSNMKDPLLE